MDNFSSNTLAPSSNQSWFLGDGKSHKGRIFYKIFAGGKYNYSLMFTNTIDSTFSDGRHSQANTICDSWEIVSLGLYITKTVSNNLKIEDKIPLTFNKKANKTVIPGEIFYADSVELDCKKDDYICLEIEYKGNGKIPYMEEMMIPSFVYENNSWVESKQTPLAASILCDRRVEKKVGFFGDSITEGIGVANNSYSWWCSQIANIVGERYSYWDIGIGFGRAQDGASKGAWLNKAKMLDTVTVCFGVNDICQGYGEEIVKKSLYTIVSELKNAGKRVILFTIPPFDYDENKTKIWHNVNSYIRTQLSKEVEIYDVATIWGHEAPNEHKAKYGGHPNLEDSTVMARDFVKKVVL